MTTNAKPGAPLGNTGWYLIGRPAESGTCEHCGRALKYCYRVVNADAVEMTVGRGCVKKLTGWTLTAAIAERMIKIAERNARRAANWALFEQAHPEAARTILADVAAYEDRATPGMGASLSHEARDRMSDDWQCELGDYLPYYLRRRPELWWLK
jgi:hypothetical protein